MAVCYRCGCEFNVSTARRKIGRRYGAGTYDEFYPDGDVCEECAIGELSAADAEGAEIIELMGPGYDPD